MKTFKLFSMAALALVMAACSSDDNEIQQPEEQGKMHFTATLAAPNNGPTTRTVATADGDNYNVAWKVGDVIALIYTDSESDRQKDEATVTAVDGSGNATIECDLSETVNDGADVTLVYPYDVVGDAAVNACIFCSHCFIVSENCCIFAAETTNYLIFNHEKANHNHLVICRCPNHNGTEH